MKIILIQSIALLALAGVEPLVAQTNTLPAHHTLGAAGAGGGSGQSALYSHHGSLGAIDSAVGTATGEGGILYTSKAGDAGAQYDIVSLAASANPESVAENAPGQLQAEARLEDDTTLALDPADILWSLLAGPIDSIDAAGHYQAALVYNDQPASIRASYAGLTDDVNLRVLNTNPDNYGRYAGDRLPDDWQVGHFGENNPDARPDVDADGDDQDNSYEHYVGTDPTDPDSLFQLVIQPVLGKPGMKNLVFLPVWPDREYTVQYQAVLGVGPFLDLEKVETIDDGIMRTVTDQNAIDPAKTYRVKILFR